MSRGVINEAINYLADKTNTPIETFTGTRGSGLTAGECHGTYDKWTKTVRLYLYGTKSSNGTTSEVLFTIPSGYRPSSNITGGAIVGSLSGGTIQTTAGSLYVNSNGQIKQGATNYLRSIFGTIEYSL